MSAEVLKFIVTLGVPGFGLYVMYLLLNRFGFNFTTIGPTWSAIIAILFLLIVGFITYVALQRATGDGEKSGVRHTGELRALAAHLQNFDIADMQIILPASDQEHVGDLYVNEMHATNYSELLKRICLDYTCIKCLLDGKSVNISSRSPGAIKKVGEEEGVPIYGCAS